MVLSLVLVTIAGLRLLESRMRLIETFRSGIRSEGHRLFLPEEVPIDIGVISIKRFWHGEKRRRDVVDLRVLNPATLSTKIIELDKVCNTPFYIYADFDDRIFIEAPGFIIKSGRFKDMIMLCLEPSSIPEKRVEISADNGVEKAIGIVKIVRNGIELSLTWSFEAPKQKKIVYDEKQGVYRIVEEYSEEPKARGARLEICFQTPDSKTCTTLAKLDKLGTSTSTTLPFKIKETFVLIHKDLIIYTMLAKMIGLNLIPLTPITIGYKPGYIKARLILDMPLARDIVKEVEL